MAKIIHMWLTTQDNGQNYPYVTETHDNGQNYPYVTETHDNGQNYPNDWQQKIMAKFFPMRLTA